MRSVSHYCQKCLAANPLGQELCARCGTRLMLVVEPPTARFEEGGLVASHEEHLLERISALENRFMRLTDKLEQALNLMLKQARSIYFDHTLLDTLIEVLNEAGSFDAVRLNKLWRERCQKDNVENEEIARREQARSKIISAYVGAESATFERMVNEGIDLLNKNEAIEGIRALERSAAFAPDNAPLNALLGAHFFEAGKNALARVYLERAILVNPKSEGLRLLLGVACADDGEIVRAKSLLKSFIKYVGESFAARYGLGRLLMAEGKSAEALKEFKRALSARSMPEADYAVGCLYYHLGRYRLAAQHLRQAVKSDARYHEAHYALGITLLRLGVNEESRLELIAACETDEQLPCVAGANHVLRTGRPPANPKFWGTGRGAKKGLIMGGDRRLAEAVRQDALDTVKTLSFPN
ncbi:MAG TPA: tetratricopeptide repeat protein [Pyrinomonadaceae bacterium]